MPKLLNLDDFWGDNSNCQLSEPIVYNSLKQVKKGKYFTDNLESFIVSSSEKQENDRRNIYFNETGL